MVWIWAGVGLVAVVIFIASGVGRKPRLELTSPPNFSQPIIVEPIQPSNPAQPPLVTSEQQPPAPVAETLATASTSSAATEAVSVRPAALPSEGPDRIRKIQQALLSAGYNPGPVDGKMGRMTQKAIRDFQEANSLSVDGKVGPKTWAKLAPFLNTESSTTSTESL